jgi:transcriptional regulator with XRE-family HTH domain
MTQREIGAHLRGIRLKKGLSFYNIQKGCGLFISTIKDIEEGEKNVTLNKVLCYAEYLGYEVDLKKIK